MQIMSKYITDVAVRDGQVDIINKLYHKGVVYRCSLLLQTLPVLPAGKSHFYSLFKLKLAI